MAVLACRPVGVPAVVVDDVLDALAALARTVLAEVPQAMVSADAQAMAEAAQEDDPRLQVVSARDRDHALNLARDLIEPGGIVLVKGSHSVGLEHTAVCLAQPATAADDR